MPETHHITRAATIIGLGTLGSRLFGFLRDVVIAHFFGAGMAADAFFVAFRIPNLWRRLVGEGSLTISFIPVYTEYLTPEREEESRELANIAFTVAGIILLCLTILGIVFSPLLIRVVAPGFVRIPEKFHLTVTLNQVIFPYLFFMGLFALSMGILNAKRHFFAPAFAPIFLNVSIILSVLVLYHIFERPVFALAIGVLAGGILQFLFQVPFLVQRGIRYRVNLNFRHPAIRRIGTLMIPGLIGTAVYQLNVFIDTIFASFLPSGSVSYLFFADRLMEFPLGIFAIAIGMAALPSLSKLAAEGKGEELRETVRFAFRLVSFISVPAMVGLIALKTPIVNLLFQRGKFDLSSTVMTARALFCYAVGLWAIAGARTVVPAFYALKDTWTPLKIAFLCLGANVVLNGILIGPLQHAGLALATSLSSTLNLVLLYWHLKAKIGPMGIRKDLWALLKNLLCSVPMGVAAFLICSLGQWSETGNEGIKALLLVTGIGVGAILYAWTSYQLKVEAMPFLIRTLRRRKALKTPTVG